MKHPKITIVSMEQTPDGYWVCGVAVEGADDVVYVSNAFGSWMIRGDDSLAHDAPGQTLRELLPQYARQVNDAWRARMREDERAAAAA